MDGTILTHHMEPDLAVTTPVGTCRFDLKPDVHALYPPGILKNVHIFDLVEDHDQVVPMYRNA